METGNESARSRCHLCFVSPGEGKDRKAISLATGPDCQDLCHREANRHRRCQRYLKSRAGPLQSFPGRTRFTPLLERFPAFALRGPEKRETAWFRPFALPKPYALTKDVFCLREKRTVNGYRKISLFNHEIVVPHVPLREEVKVHLTPDIRRDALEVRIWWDNRMVQSLTYPLSEFPRVHF